MRTLYNGSEFNVCFANSVNFTAAKLGNLICLTQMFNLARTREIVVKIILISANSILIVTAYANCWCN